MEDKVVHILEKNIPIKLDFSPEWFDKIDEFIVYLWDSVDEYECSESENGMYCDAANYIEELRRIKSTLLTINE